MIKAVIVEDEGKNIKILQQMLAEHCPLVQVAAVGRKVQEACQAISMHQPDLLFLDVELADGSGFEVLQNLPKINFHVIFTTAYQQYALEAIKHNALDYLLKPLDIDELIKAVEKVKSNLHQVDLTLQIANLINGFKANPVAKQLSLPTPEGFVVIKLEDIIRCEADTNYTRFFLLNGENIMVSKSIKEFEKQLPEMNFCRVHNSHIVNIHCIKKYVRGNGGYLVMQDNSIVQVSIRKKNDLMEIFKQDL